MTTASEWPQLILDKVVAHYEGLGLEPVGRIGNPTVAGTFRMECGLEVHVNYGGLGGNAYYRTQDEPFPTELPETTIANPRNTGNHAVELIVQARDCVPVRDEDGHIPTADEHTASVENMQEIMEGLFDSLLAAQAEFRADGTGYFVFTGVSPLERSGMHAGWESRIICEVC